MDSKILVTGGAGFIGSHLVDRLVKDGHNVVVVDNLSTGKYSNIKEKCKFYEADIKNSIRVNQIFEKESPKYVYHFAAQNNAREEDPIKDAHTNIIGGLNVLEACYWHPPKRIIYAGSGGTAYGNPVYLPCDESHPVNPISPYGISKHSFEHYLKYHYEKYGLEYINFRFPNVYGERQNPDGKGEAGVIPIFINKMLKNEEVKIYGSGLQERDFVYVSDIVEANVLAMQNYIPSGIYNLGSGQGLSVDLIYAIIKEYTRYNKMAVRTPPIVEEVYRTYLSASKFEQWAWWKPQVGIYEGIKKTVEYISCHLKESGL